MPNFCPHNAIGFKVVQLDKLIRFNPKGDPDVVVMQIAVHCADCGMPFEPLGVPKSQFADSAFGPSTNPSGTVLAIPFKPGASRFMGFDKEGGLLVS